MPIFLNKIDLKEKYKRIKTLDKMIKKELIDLNKNNIDYEYVIESDGFIKIDIITDEIRLERKNKELLREKLTHDLPDELIECFAPKTKEEVVSTLINSFGQRMSYTEAIEHYEDAILKGIMKTYEIIKPILNDDKIKNIKLVPTSDLKL